MISLLFDFIILIQHILWNIFISPIIWLLTTIAFYIWDFIKWLFVQLCWLLEWIVKMLYRFVKWGCNKIAAKINAARNQA